MVLYNQKKINSRERHCTSYLQQQQAEAYSMGVNNCRASEQDIGHCNFKTMLL